MTAGSVGTIRTERTIKSRVGTPRLAEKICWLPSRYLLQSAQTQLRVPMGNRHLRILVVDDEKLVCDAVKLMLDFDGHEVQAAASGREALSLLQESHYDLVVTDYHMPEMKGDELAAEIHSKNAGPPVVMITAYPERLQQPPPQGVSCVISKPFRLEDLREAIACYT